MLSAGFDAHIAKPIVPQTFVNQIEELLPLEKRCASNQTAADPLASPRKARLIKELSATFARNVPNLLASLWAAHAAKDFQSLRKAAHMTLGSCIFLNEPRLIEDLRRLERSIGGNEPRDLQPLLQEIDREVLSVTRRIGETTGAEELIR
jgi:HPt (histidine-containing phosphotransfer) domain-containing protein